MRLICGCIGATDGKILLDGVDIQAEPIKAKSKLGYLPEHPPLYTRMTVEKYLQFAASLRYCPPQAVDKVIEQTKLGSVRTRFIDQLSKGFRQRVGLAQAIVHEPSIVVLDEPMSGLDPAQRVEFRELLVDLAASDTTVVLSTHVLQEIEAVCDRVMILAKGQLVAQDSLERLRNKGQSGTKIMVRSAPESLLAALHALPALTELRMGLEGPYPQLTIYASADIRAEIASAAAPYGLLSMTEPEKLEQIYLRLTGGL